MPAVRGVVGRHAKAGAGQRSSPALVLVTRDVPSVGRSCIVLQPLSLQQIGVLA